LCEVLVRDRSSSPWGLLPLPSAKASFHYHINFIITDDGDEYRKRKWRAKGKISRLEETDSKDGKKYVVEPLRRNVTSPARLYISVSWSSMPKSFYKIKLVAMLRYSGEI
jgi:hypothetical protein